MDAIDRLLAIEEIKSLRSRYFRCVDLKDWDGFMAIFAPDAVFDITDDNPGCIITGKEEILAFVRPALDGCVSVHHGHCPEITVTSDTTASGIWAMEDMLRWDDPEAPLETLHGYGHYRETYRKIDGCWLVQTMKLTRMRVDIIGKGGVKLR